MRNLSALAFLMLACSGAAFDRNMDQNDVLRAILKEYKSAAGKNARTCETQYQDLLQNYSDRLMQYVNYFMLSVGFDPTTMPDIENSITATDPNSDTWDGTILYYNTVMYDNSRFDTKVLLLECAPDYLDVKLFLALPGMKTRGRFKLDIANAHHYGFIDGSMMSFILVEYTMNYNNFFVNRDFQIIDKGNSNFTMYTNYFGSDIDWTLGEIKESMFNIFLNEYSKGLREILQVSIDDAMENTKVVQ